MESDSALSRQTGFSVDLVRRAAPFFILLTKQPMALGEGFADHSAVPATRTADSAWLTAAVSCGQYNRHANNSITNGTVVALPFQAMSKWWSDNGTCEIDHNQNCLVCIVRHS